jgi:hypothetical protein
VTSREHGDISSKAREGFLMAKVGPIASLSKGFYFETCRLMIPGANQAMHIKGEFCTLGELFLRIEKKCIVLLGDIFAKC